MSEFFIKFTSRTICISDGRRKVKSARKGLARYEEDARPPAPDPARVAAHADTALFFGCKDLDAAYGSLRAHGLDVKGPAIAHYGMKPSSVTDPDGYNLCFQWPATRHTRDQWRAWYGLEL